MQKFKFVMLIDDNDLDTLINKKILQIMDVTEEIKSFSNGLEAINSFRLLNQIELLPDLILLDLNMPTMDGFEFMKQYKKLPTSIQKGKIVILSSSNDPKDLKMSSELGCVDYIIKPLTTDKLNKVLNRLESKIRIENS